MNRALPGVAASSGELVVIGFHKLRSGCASRRCEQLHNLASWSWSSIARAMPIGHVAFDPNDPRGRHGSLLSSLPAKPSTKDAPAMW